MDGRTFPAMVLIATMLASCAGTSESDAATLPITTVPSTTTAATTTTVVTTVPLVPLTAAPPPSVGASPPTLPTTTSVYADWTDVVAAERGGVLRIAGTSCDDGYRRVRGTGFLVGNGLLVTAAHVVDGYSALMLDRIDNDPASRPATLVGIDVAEDIAVLQTEMTGYEFIFDDTVPRQGSDVGLIGYSGGLAPVRPTRGTVNKTEVSLTAYGDNDQYRPSRLIQHDIQSNGGDSGAPLIDTVTGRVVGVNVASATDLVGIKYAVYPDVAEAMIAAISTGSVIDPCGTITPPAITAPTATPPPSAPVTTVAPVPTTAAEPGTLRYQVFPGDTLFGIARAFNTSVAAIEKVNDPAALVIIYPNDIIVLPANARALTPSDVATRTYTVQAGDTIIGVARANDTTPAELLAINGKLSSPDVLRVGQLLLIPTS